MPHPVRRVPARWAELRLPRGCCRRLARAELVEPDRRDPPGVGMTVYRITPVQRAYRVEAVEEDGQCHVVQVWPTEEAAVSHLKDLRAKSERANRPEAQTNRGWQG